MQLKNVLVIYKKSAYRIYFLEQRSTIAETDEVFAQHELERFRKSHKEHYATLRSVRAVLNKHKIPFTTSNRGQIVDYDAYDLVITIGGDGTFLEAARGIKHSVLLGVNSSLSFSVGNFCVANINNFETVLLRVLKTRFRPTLLSRLHLDIDHHRNTIDCLNDVLVCHSNPAAMNRYLLKVGRVKEEQRGSGLWIAAPAGSSGAINSAGGKRLPHTARKIQYMPRELYWGGKWKYRLIGGILSSRQSITVTSLMRQGKIYVDGTHLELPFPLGLSMKVTLSRYPVKTVTA